MGVDAGKCEALKRELERLPPDDAIVAVDRFFDGNDDQSSIGCNLLDYPGIDVFRRQLIGLTSRNDVEAVYLRISEVDPGPAHWPFADTLFVVGTISLAELRQVLSPLDPDEVAPGERFQIPPSIKVRHQASVSAAWWD